MTLLKNWSLILIIKVSTSIFFFLNYFLWHASAGQGLGEHKFCQKGIKGLFCPPNWTRKSASKVWQNAKTLNLTVCTRKSMTWVLRYLHSPSFQAPWYKKVKKKKNSWLAFACFGGKRQKIIMQEEKVGATRGKNGKIGP